MLPAFSHQEHCMSHRLVGLIVAFTLFGPRSGAAQETGLSTILVRLIQNDIVLAGPPPGSPFQSHAAHFVPGEDQQLAPYLFNQAIVSQLSSYPLGSSSGGFSYTFDPTLGTYARSTTSFGPSFAERAVTLGRRRWNVGANYQHVAFRSFEGKRLDGGNISFYLTHEPLGNNAFFEGDIVEAALSMDLDTDTFVMYANYGITNRLDVGIGVPIVRVSLDASVNATILRLATGDTPPGSTIHTFPGGASSSTFSEGGTASGIGDILLRSKYHFYRGAGGGLAAAVDVRAPTGDEDNLLGTGVTQTRILLVGSGTAGTFAPHFNVGYTISGTSSNPLFNITDEFGYALGTEYTPWPKVTFAADLLGRQLRDSGLLVETPKTFAWRTQAGVSGTSTFNEFALQDGSVNLAFTAIGAKYNAAQNLLISGSVLFPLMDSGMRSRPVPVIGFDYTY
jgi:hypothetical protein